MTNCLAKPFELVRLDTDGQVDTSIRMADVPAGVAFGAGDVWVALLPPTHPLGTVLRIDPSTGRTVQSFSVGDGAEYLAFGAGAVWVGNADDGTVSKIDVELGQVTATIPVSTDPHQVALAGGYVWVNNRSDHSTSKIDPLKDRVVDIVDGVRGTMAGFGGDLWVADPEAPTLWRVDTADGRVTAEYSLTYSGFVAAGSGSIWISEPVTFDDQCCP